MLDFEFNLRWGRFAYIGALSLIIGYWFGIFPALICMLGVIDIRLDPELFENSDSGENTTFGPQKSDDT